MKESHRQAVIESNKRRAKHNQAHTGESSKVHKAWVSIKQRCLNPKSAAYHRYGGRGVTVCKEWADSFESFYKYVGEPPTPKHTLDRIDNNKGYEPDNVRWATRKEQSNNTNSNTWVEYDGKRMTWAQWAEYLGIGYNCLMTRVRDKTDLKDILVAGNKPVGRPKGVKETKPRERKQ